MGPFWDSSESLTESFRGICLTWAISVILSPLEHKLSCFALLNTIEIHFDVHILDSFKCKNKFATMSDTGQLITMSSCCLYSTRLNLTYVEVEQISKVVCLSEH